jgi:hypothetical protein
LYKDTRIILLPLPRATKVEPEAESATRAGGEHERNADAVSIFTLEVSGEDWNGVVLTVADGQGWLARGGRRAPWRWTPSRAA